jgi:hypothetical protein
MVCAPAVSDAVVIDAWPATRGTGSPSGEPSAWNWTGPEGTGPDDTTLAVNVTAWPTVVGESEAATWVVDGWASTSVVVEASEPTKSSSSAGRKTARSERVPTASPSRSKVARPVSESGRGSPTLVPSRNSSTLPVGGVGWGDETRTTYEAVDPTATRSGAVSNAVAEVAW